MERKEHKELKATGNEGEWPEQPIAGDHDSAGASSAPARRYYDCIFCRRGFSTAQALGGHMNIHRRDRPRVRPAAAPPLMRREEGYHPYSREQGYSPTAPAAENYVVYFPESSSSMESEISPRRWPGAEKEKEMEDLDLELRLGHGGRYEKP